MMQLHFNFKNKKSLKRILLQSLSLDVVPSWQYAGQSPLVMIGSSRSLQIPVNWVRCTMLYYEIHLALNDFGQLEVNESVPSPCKVR